MVRSKRRLKAQKRNLIAYSHPDSIISEQFRMIQTNIKFLIADDESRTILVTSPSEGEGKSTLIANLAVSMALQKDRILVIDANLRNPALQTIFKVPKTKGLVNVINGEVIFKEAVYKTEIGELDVLISGPIPQNPVELLGSKTFKELLKEVSNRYDVVLVDSSPVLEVTDTKLLANICDAVILVANRYRTSVSETVETRKDLELAKANLIGVVLNE